MEALGARSGAFAAPRGRGCAALRPRSFRSAPRVARVAAVRASGRPDHEVFGMYIFGAGAGVRGAPVDVRTGEFLAGGLSTPLASTSQEALCAAVKKLVEQADWTGHVGVAVPGRVQDFGGVSPEDWAAGRGSRAVTERLLEAASGCRVVALGGAEAIGAGEVAYGAARDAPGLVMTATVGANGLGVALFEDGELVRGLDVRSVLASWSPPGAVVAAPPTPESSAAEWSAWAERIDRILLQLDSVLHPQRIVLGGSAVREGGEGGAERLINLLTVRDRVPGGVQAAQMGLLGGVKGAAWAAAREFRTRAALTAVKAALGATAKVAPADLGADRLRAVFAQYAVAPAAGGEAQLTRQALGSMLKALGVSLEAPAAGGADSEGGDAALRRVFSELDSDGSGGIVFDEFAGWWDAQVRPPAGEEGPVALVVSADELESILCEEPAGKLVCLEVGMTFCRPCKAFEKTYKGVAAETPQARFLRVNGNENRSCTSLARDTLGVRSTPAFYFFRAGPPAPGAPPGVRPHIDSHTGANEQRLRDAVTRLLAPPGADGAAAAAPQTPPRVEAGKIDTSEAKKSGLADILGRLSIKTAYLDKLKAQLKASEASGAAEQAAKLKASIETAEKEKEELQGALEATTGHPRKQGPGSR